MALVSSNDVIAKILESCVDRIAQAFCVDFSCSTWILGKDLHVVGYTYLIDKLEIRRVVKRSRPKMSPKTLLFNLLTLIGKECRLCPNGQIPTPINEFLEARLDAFLGL